MTIVTFCEVLAAIQHLPAAAEIMLHVGFGAQWARTNLGRRLRVYLRAHRVFQNERGVADRKADGLLPSARRIFFGLANDDGFYAKKPGVHPL